MDPALKNWMFFSWMEEKKQQIELYRNLCIFIGGFINPEAAKKILSKDENSIESNDEDFEKSLNIVKEANENMEKKTSLRRRRKRKIG